MRQVPFRLIGGMVMFPGALMWFRRVMPPKRVGGKPSKAPRQMVRIEDVLGECDLSASQTMVLISFPEGATEEVSAETLSPVGFDPPKEGEVPESYVPAYEVTVSGVRFYIGAVVYIFDTVTVGEMTGHAIGPPTGHIAGIALEGTLLVHFPAVRGDRTNKTFLLEVSPQEILVVLERVSIGERLRMEGTKGKVDVDLYNPEWTALQASSE